MARPTAAALKRLHALEAPQRANDGRGVMLLPAPGTLDEWEAEAVPSQAKLMSASAVDRNDEAPKVRDSGGGLTDATASYKNLARTRP
jgi:hypothetical protein